MDSVPRNVEGNDVTPLVEKVRETIENLDWVKESAIRLRAYGHVYYGEAYVIPHSEEALLENIEAAVYKIQDLDWRINDFLVMPVREINIDRSDAQ